MSLTLLSFFLTILGMNIFLLLIHPIHWLSVIVYWNASNLAYLVLNILLLTVINFEAYEWVQVCLMDLCCYA